MNVQAFVEQKILSDASLEPALARWKTRGEKVVFTNGCFDLIHFGHLQYLMQARELGDRLMVGLNSDASVQRLKGPQRPVKEQVSRQLLLASLVFVDAVIVFEEDTPARLIQQVRPDVLVKGGDYRPEQIVGREWAAEVKILPFAPGFSSTRYVEKIQKSG